MLGVNRGRRPMSVSTVNIDVDDVDVQAEEDYRRAHTDFEETSSSKTEDRKARFFLIALILVIIIVTLLSVAGLIIGIYSLVLSTNTARAANTNTALVYIGSATSVSTASTVINTSTVLTCSSSPTTSYQYSTATPPQCTNYTLNTDTTRNSAYTATINSCDNISPFNNATSIWIRFVDPAGQLIVNSPVPPNHCGTVATGWYAGQYPATTFTTATSIVCFYYSTNTCMACSSISVTNCQGFYVFLLPLPPSCNYRYCTL